MPKSGFFRNRFGFADTGLETLLAAMAFAVKLFTTFDFFLSHELILLVVYSDILPGRALFVNKQNLTLGNARAKFTFNAYICKIKHVVFIPP
jgi:hypothetical protein